MIVISKIYQASPTHARFQWISADHKWQYMQGEKHFFVDLVL
tara:strand:- start:940 stop:1065 length:126 start_codon:yes stop_codon:yes gene_type:complete